MTIDKLPSGSYRIRHTENGKTYSLTVPYRPKEKEAFTLIQNKINHSSTDMPFSTACDQYLTVKNNVLSPSTIRGYNSIKRNIPDWFMETDISQIDRFTCQKLVNEYAADHSAKSVSNLNGFIQAVLKLFYPDLHISVTLPQKVRKKPYMPSQDDVKRLLEHAKDTEYYIPFYLATLSLRLSEICALTIFDLKDNTITINKALVRAEKGYILKNTPKTDASNREIIIPDKLAEEIRKKGYIYKGYPNQIGKNLTKMLDELEIPHFSIHKLRHFFASYSHDLGYNDATVQSVGGWNSDVMKRTYRHAMQEEENRKSIAAKFSF